RWLWGVSKLGRGPANVLGPSHPHGAELGGAPAAGPCSVWHVGTHRVAAAVSYGYCPTHRWRVAGPGRPPPPPGRAGSLTPARRRTGGLSASSGGEVRSGRF